MNIKKHSEKYCSNSVLGNNTITLQMKVKLGAYTDTVYKVQREDGTQKVNIQYKS